MMFISLQNNDMMILILDAHHGVVDCFLFCCCCVLSLSLRANIMHYALYNAYVTTKGREKYYYF